MGGAAELAAQAAGGTRGSRWVGEGRGGGKEEDGRTADSVSMRLCARAYVCDITVEGRLRHLAQA